MIGLLWVFLEKIGLTVLSLIATFWYAILLGPDSYGEVTILASIVFLISGFQDNIQQFPLIATKKKAIEKNEYIFYTSFKGWILISVITSSFLFVVLLHFLGSDKWLLILIATLHLPVSSMSKVFVADLIKKQAFKKLAIRSFLGRAIGVISGLALAYTGNAALAIISQSFIALVVALAVMTSSTTLFANTKFSLSYKNFDWSLFKALIKEGIPSGVSLLDHNAKSHGIIIILGAIVGPHASGIFALAIKIIDTPRKLVNHSFSTWATAKFHAAKDNHCQLIKTYRMAFSWAMMIIFPSYLGIMAISDALIMNFFGADWIEVKEMIFWLAIYHLIISYFLYLSPLLVLYKLTYNTLKVTLFSTVFMLFFVITTSNIFGIYSPIIAMFISLLVIIPKYIKELNAILKTSPKELILQIFGFFISAIFMCLVITYSTYQFETHNLYLLILIGFLSYLCTIVILVFLKIINFNILNNIRNF